MSESNESNVNNNGFKNELENMVKSEQEQAINKTVIGDINIEKNIVNKSNIEDEFNLR